ncbi:MAG TPA: hypothetical protein VK928_07800, partial [Longimicrobiales bacterium]|nr:hypothetical protein [Longimicrobiales bacterium]
MNTTDEPASKADAPGGTSARAGTQHAGEDLDALARRFAPVLVCSPEIPVSRSPDAALRSTWTRSDDRSASRPTDGAHMTRDFHPCDVRLILAHAQAWEPAMPLPLVPSWFSRAYRDLARLFFWPITFLVIVLVLMLTFAQGLPTAAQASVELGVLVVLGIIYLVTLRSPILVPVDHWHHLNHAVIGGGLIIALGAEFGTAWLWLYGPVIVIPTVLSMLTTVALRIVSGLSNGILLLLQKVRSLFLRLRSGATRKAPDIARTSRLFHGLKAAH